MKRLLLFLSVVSAVFASTASTVNYVEEWGQLKLVGNQLSSATGNPVQLKGWSTQELQLGAMDGCTGAEQWHLMHQYGANVVRLAMGVDKPGAYMSDPRYWKSKIKEYISEIANEGMYCIVDWNILATDDYSGDPNDFLRESQSFFEEISKYCADNGYNNVLYEICSEATCGWDKIKYYAENVIHVILKNQANALIIVGTDSWSLKIIEPLVSPLESKYKNNVLYSFHYSACNHYAFLGDFRAAQKSMPVFVSEWSAVNFNGDGPMCESNGDALLNDCDVTESAPQLVSWCFWNWGNGNDASSSFSGECKSENLSKSDGSNSNPQVGEYSVKKLSNYIPCACVPLKGPYEVQKIPNTNSGWNWKCFDLGGEGYAYHDENSSAYVKDAKGNIVDYAIGDECDAYSQAYRMQYLDKKNPWYTVSGDVDDYSSPCNCNGDYDMSVVDYDKSVEYTTLEGDASYKSLNAGKTVFGDGCGRPDEGVDLGIASLLGTPFANGDYNHLMSIEKGEWINYTVDVAEPGYYKIEAYVSGEYVPGEISFYQDRGNIVRSTSDFTNKSDYGSIHFDRPDKCADASVDRETSPWDCWELKPAMDIDDEPFGHLVFVKEGVQELKVYFHSPSGGVGPLIFTKLELENIDDVLSAESDETVFGFTIAPNPTLGEFTVTLAKSGKAIVEIANIAGQIVYSEEMENSVTINKSLVAGVYSVVVKSNGGVNTQKLVVK
ncbi:MAG: cellulase family glycosylhydrolase [Paludibacteraceae bacterium]|nr:cellulase family glycosylhydrolase [Paludibacteraceae bacterium]